MFIRVFLPSHLVTPLMSIEIIHLFKVIKISMLKKFGHFLDCCSTILVNDNKITNMDSKKNLIYFLRVNKHLWFLRLTVFTRNSVIRPL